MAMTKVMSYQRLQQEICSDEDEEDVREHVIGGLRSSRPRRVHIRRKLRIRFPILKTHLRRESRWVKSAWTKIRRRLKESQSYFGDLFAGNYLFMQVTPTMFNYKSCGASAGNWDSFVKNHDLPRSSSRYMYSYV